MFNTTFKQLLNSPWLWILWLSLQIPALRALFKYTPEALLPVAAPAYGLATFAGLILLIWLWEKIENQTISQTVFWGGLAVYAAACWFIYPIADGMKLQNRGSDQDDAIIQGAWQIWNVSNPYEAATYFGNPISPGPGWIVLLSPLVWLGLYALLSPIALGLTAWILEKTSNIPKIKGFFLLCTLSTLCIWELGVVGSDLPAFSAACTLLALWAGRTLSLPQALALGILAGFIATGRTVFFYLPLVLALIQWPHNRKNALLIGLLGLCTCAGLHWFFLHLSGNMESYPPLHLLAKGESLLTTQTKIAALLACIGSGLMMLKLTHRRTPEAALSVMWLALITPLLFVALCDLAVYRGGDLAAWEGANYLIPPLFVMVGLVSLLLQQTPKEKSHP